jgi:hypothetical protein
VLNVPQARKLFWKKTMELLVDVAHVESHSVHSMMVLVSVQDRCMVCAKHTIGLEIILDAPDGTPS